MLEEYNEAREKYGKDVLPGFIELEKIAELCPEENEGNVLAKIRRKIADKLKSDAEIIEELIHPSTSLSSMHESGCFNEEEKKELTELYWELMGIIRKSEKLDIAASEQEDAKFIKSLYENWKSLKGKLLLVFEKLESCWKEKEDLESKAVEYLG